jgi:glycosyltransferase involved in cell wall biosynthesis
VKIGFVSQYEVNLTPQPRRSIEIWTYEVARRLALANEVVVFRGSGAPRPVEIVEGVRYRQIDRPSSWFLRPFSILDRLSAHPRRHDGLFRSPFYFPRYALRVARLVRDERCDVVHVHNYLHAVPLIRFLNPAAKIVLHMHCDWLAALDERLVRRAAGAADVILGCSNAIAARVAERFPEFAARCSVVGNGVDVERFASASPRAKAGRRLLFVGRLSPEKGLHVLIDAFAQIADAFPDATLELVGPDALQPAAYLSALGDPLVDPAGTLAEFYTKAGTLPDYCRALRARVPERLRSRVVFSVGEVPQSEMAAVYERADVLVNPSLSEAFGMTLLEAMSAGLPVVATRVGGIPEVVASGELGLLVPPNDVGTLASALRDVLTDEHLRNALSRNSASRAAQFAWPNVAAAYSAMLSALPARTNQIAPSAALLKPARS